MSFELPALPYEMNALEPHLSKETLEFHYGKHHKAYVDKLNAAVAGKPEADKTLEELIKTASGGVFNNAAQIWNHTFYWYCLSPDGGGAASNGIGEAITKSFGSFGKFKEEFSNASATLFGSGWAWLVKDGDAVKIVQTKDADNPLRTGQQPLLTLDVWEHAYYIDYRNARPKYIDAFWNLVNWDFVEKQYQSQAETLQV